MNSKVKDVLLLICTALLAFSIFLLYQMDNRLQNLDSQIANQYNMLSSEVGSIYSNVDAALTKQASILDSYDYQVGQINTADLTVPVTFRIFPKEYSENTAATLWMDEQSFHMQQSGNAFTVTVSIPVVNNGYLFTVSFKDRGLTRTETLNIYSDFLREAIPNGFANFEGQVASDMEDGAHILNFNGSVHMELYNYYPSENPVKSAKLCVSAGDKILYKTDVSVDDILNAAPIEITEKLEIPANTECQLYIELADNYGLCYRFISYSIEVDENGEPKESAEAAALTTNIYDSTGKLLFENYY